MEHSIYQVGFCQLHPNLNSKCSNPTLPSEWVGRYVQPNPVAPFDVLVLCLWLACPGNIFSYDVIKLSPITTISYTGHTEIMSYAEW